MPYALIPIGIVIIILYALTFLLFRAGIISKKLHRQIWNTVLLSTRRFGKTGRTTLSMICFLNFA